MCCPSVWTSARHQQGAVCTCAGGFILAELTSDLLSDGAQAWLQCLLLQGRADAEKEQAESRSCADWKGFWQVDLSLQGMVREWAWLNRSIIQQVNTCFPLICIQTVLSASERPAGLKVKIEEKAHLSSAVDISCTGSLWFCRVLKSVSLLIRCWSYTWIMWVVCRRVT